MVDGTTRRSLGSMLAGVLLLAAAGCGSEPPSAPPSGVDELVVPSPSPRAADFVGEVTSPWWPLRSGAVWSYRSGESEMRREVLPRRRLVGGVPATGVRTTVSDGGEAAPDVEWFAQDRRGNVWLVGAGAGEQLDWQAGVDGEAAGLVVTATPRVGDGYVRSTPDGERVRVVEVGRRATTPAGDFEVVVLEVADASGGAGEEQLARGAGLLQWRDERGVWNLVDVDVT